MNILGSSKVPTLINTPSGRLGDRVNKCVPQLEQKSRFRGVSRSFRVYVFGAPLEYLKSELDMPKTTFGWPPEKY